MPARTADCGSLVSLGGDTAVTGEPPAGGWHIRVQDETARVDRLPERGSHATVGIRSGGLATSGTTARRRDHHLHHIVDPRTGRPATTPWRTVSVAAATCADANAATTAALVKGESAIRRLSRLGLPARLATQEGTVVMTPGWPSPTPAAAPTPTAPPASAVCCSSPSSSSSAAPYAQTARPAAPHAASPGPPPAG